jgi:hypothetical protein
MTIINYIIATHPNISRRIKTDRYSSNVLRYHLKILSLLLNKDSLIKQITIVHPDAPDTTGYYTGLNEYIDIIKSYGINVIDMPVENEGISYSQYIRCYLKYNEFDYYYITEDDWVINLKYNKFDKLLVNMYNKLFPSDIGLLDAWSPDSGSFVPKPIVNTRKGGFGGNPFHSAITLGLISNKAFQLIKDVNIIHKDLDQLSFSTMLLDNNIEIKDIFKGGLNVKILFWQTWRGLIEEFTENSDTADEAFYVPIQYYYKITTYLHRLSDEITVVHNDLNLFNQ